MNANEAKAGDIVMVDARSGLSCAGEAGRIVGCQATTCEVEFSDGSRRHFSYGLLDPAYDSVDKSSMKVGDVVQIQRGCTKGGMRGFLGEIIDDAAYKVDFPDMGVAITYHPDDLELVTADKKDTNPKDAIGLSKAALSVLPLPPLYEAALAMAEGAMKYGRHNYRAASVRYSVYFDAIQRHLALWYEGQDTAPDSGCHHLGHVMACCIILLDDMLGNNQGTDDRPPVIQDPDWLSRMNERMAELLKRYPNPEPPCTNL